MRLHMVGVVKAGETCRLAEREQAAFRPGTVGVWADAVMRRADDA